MGRSRNQRARKESTFLEQVHDLLLSLHRDVADMKTSLASTCRDNDTCNIASQFVVGGPGYSIGQDQ
eukprot:10549735-Karenia_brevis.AAC.1